MTSSCSLPVRPWRKTKRKTSHRKKPRKPRRRDKREPAQNILRLLPADSVSEKSIATAQGKLSLYRDRRHARFLRPAGQSERLGLLHRLHREGRQPARDLRLQWRARRGFRLSASRSGRPAHSRTRAGRPRRGARDLERQSGDLAALYRFGADRSDRHRLEPRRQARGRQRLLEREQRRQRHGQGDLALRHA